MRKKIAFVYSKLPKWIKNRYFASTFLFFIWILFFDINSILVQINQTQEIKKLKNDISYYEEEIKKDTEIINTISKDSLTPDLEKYLREILFLSKKNEEIFIIE